MAKFLIVGLGNPGEKYESTRHNTGFMVVDVVSSGEEWKDDSKKKTEVLKMKLEKSDVTLIKPQTFMNKSGSAVGAYKTKPEQVIVAHDDVDLPVGSIKVSFGRGSGGHNGVESVRRALKTKDFVRVRVGVASATPSGKIKKPKGEQKVLDHLMGEFSKKETKAIKGGIKIAAQAIETVVTEGRAKAMNKFN